MVSDPDYADNAIDGFKKRLREDGPLASFAAAPAMTAQVPYTHGQAGFALTTSRTIAHGFLVAVCSAEVLGDGRGLTRAC